MSAETVNGISSVDNLRVFRGAGQGTFNGLFAAALSHWAWDANLFILAFVYGLGMAKLRGWPELAGILTMIGATVLYATIYEVVASDAAGLGLTIGLSVLAVSVFGVYVFTVPALVNRARVRALGDGETMGVNVERSQHWEEKHFAKLRAKLAADKHPAPLFIGPSVWTVLGVAVAWFGIPFVHSRAWFDNRLIDSLATGVAFFQVIVFGRMVQYLTRLHQPRGDAVLARSEHRPILFLRPFALDALPVSPIGDKWWAFINPYAWLDKRTFEEYLSATFEDLGPVIAIGRPGEEVALLGAAREYADDASWQTLVLDRAEISQLVIMEVDATPGMVWEIDHVSRLVGLQRILIVLPPGPDLFEKRSVEWYQRWAGLQRRFAFLPDVSNDTAAVLYDRDNQPILVAGKESSVRRSLTAIKNAWLEQKAQVSRT